MNKPEVVTAEEWQAARDELLLAEKEATRALDALAAWRRRLPMVKFSADYPFESETGTKTLLDLFDGRTQLVLYQFMDNGPGKFCGGCTNFTNNVTNLPSINAKDITFVIASDMPFEQMHGYWQEKGWTVPHVSSRGSSFSVDCEPAGGFSMSVFLRDGDDVYRTYFTTSRGVDALLFDAKIMDLAPYGRQEDWEDSPAGWPQHPTYG